jgi:hypothetical protein
MSVNTAFFARFKKVIALVGSDREGERHSAADKAFEMCEENDLSLLEALDGSFGVVADAINQEALWQKIAELEDANRRLAEMEDDNRKLSEALNILNAHRPLSPETGKELLQKLWSHPQARLIAALLLDTNFDWFTPLHISWLRRVHPVVEYAVIWMCMFIVGKCVWDWAVAEYARRGLGVTLLKAVVLVAGLAFAAIAFAGDEAGCWITLFFTGILTVTNGAEWLAEKLAHSNNEWCVALRSWFL